MSKKQKLLDAFLAKPLKRNLRFQDLAALFQSLGYALISKDASRFSFWNRETGDVFDMHRPHPDDLLKLYVAKKSGNFYDGVCAMSNLLRYKGYAGTVEFSAEDRVFFGQIAFMTDTVLFEGKTVTELEAHFKESVRHYIDTCKKADQEPQKAFKGNFPERIKPALHKKAALVALQRNISLNKLAEIAIEHEIASDE